MNDFDNKFNMRLKLTVFITILVTLCVIVRFKNNQTHVQWIASLGSHGTEDGQFLHIEDFAFDLNGNLLVTDADRADIQVLSANGQFITKLSDVTDDAYVFEEPEGIVVDKDGYIFVADSDAGFVNKFDQNYNYLFSFSGLGSKKNELIHSEFMTISPTNQLLYISDAGNFRVSAFDLEGNIQFTFGEKGDAPGQFNYPQASKANSLGQIWVADFFNNRVQVFDSNGNLINVIGKKGDQPAEFIYPAGIAIDKFDNVYVADRGNYRVQVFDREGNFKYTFGKKGRGKGSFGKTLGIIVSDDGYIYLADTENSQIEKFKILNWI